MRTNIANRAAAWAFIIAIAVVRQASAYKEKTHKELSERAWLASVLASPEALTRLGVDAATSTRLIAQVRDGADREDGGARSFNHFFDPVRGTGLKGGLLGAASPTWALEDRAQFDQGYSYRDARERLYKALTASTGRERSEYFDALFRNLGQVIHHIQDMAQPQHVRDDIHLEYFGFDDDGYEAFTQKRLEDPHDRLSCPPYPTVNGKDDVNFLTTARSFWHTRDSDRPEGMGLAEFTNANFVSEDTNFGKSIYPSPSMEDARKREMSWDEVKAAFTAVGDPLPVQCTDTKPCTMGFVETPVADRYRLRAEPSVNRRTATYSIFDQDLDARGQPVVYSLNTLNFRAAHDFLIPRAVAYSAGLINYFFRGRLAADGAEVTETGVRLYVRNAIDPSATPAWKDESLNAGGRLVLVCEYDDAQGTQRHIRSNVVALSETLAPETTSRALFSFTFTDSVPTDASRMKYRLVYRGKLGQEEDGIAIGEVQPVGGFAVALPPGGTLQAGMVARTLGAWRFFDRLDLVSGNIDWKGKTVDGRPTRVLSWVGPSSRSFATRLPNPFRNEIYQNGESFAYAPGPVLGAAITTDGADKEWIVAVVTSGNGVRVVRRENRKFTQLASWEDLGEQSFGEYGPDRPWFFNDAGTEAQTMRRIGSGKHARMKLELTGTSVRFSDLGNDAGIQTRVTTMGEWSGLPTSCQGTGSASRLRVTEESYSGGYIAAVDYRGNQEVIARFVRSGTRVTQRMSVAPWTTHCDADERFYGSTISNIRDDFQFDDDTETVLEVSMGGTTVDKVVLEKANRTLTGTFEQLNTYTLPPRATTTDAGDHDIGIRHGTATESGETALAGVDYLDLRNRLSVTEEAIVSLSNTMALADDSYCPGDRDRYGTRGRLRFQDQALITFTHWQEPWPPECYARERGWFPQDVALLYAAPSRGDSVYYLERETLHAPNGNWAVDASGNLAASQETGADEHFTYLSGGSLEALLPPPTPSGVRYRLGVVR
jgi:hypothetical protein